MKPLATAGDPVLLVSNLTVRRGPVEILRGLSWRVGAGEHWVILGANGSGKTSLLAAITGYLTASGGEIEALGAKYGRTDWRELRRRIGLVSSALRQLMADDEPAAITVAGGQDAVIDYWGDPPPEVLRKARALLEIVEALPLADRPWGALSQGERQRVLIARALMAQPALLILDEPCAGLDPIARERFLEFLDSLCRQPEAPAVALVTHHVEEIVPAINHALLLRDGSVQAAGPIAQALNSETLSATFGAPVRLRRRAARFTLAVAPEGRVWRQPQPSALRRRRPLR